MSLERRLAALEQKQDYDIKELRRTLQDTTNKLNAEVASIKRDLSGLQGAVGQERNYIDAAAERAVAKNQPTTTPLDLAKLHKRVDDLVQQVGALNKEVDRSLRMEKYDLTRGKLARLTQRLKGIDGGSDTSA